MAEIYLKTELTELPKRCADCDYFCKGGLYFYDTCVLLNRSFGESSPHKVRLSLCPLREITPSSWVNDDEKR